MGIEIDIQKNASCCENSIRTKPAKFKSTTHGILFTRELSQENCQLFLIHNSLHAFQEAIASRQLLFFIVFFGSACFTSIFQARILFFFSKQPPSSFVPREDARGWQYCFVAERCGHVQRCTAVGSMIGPRKLAISWQIAWLYSGVFCHRARQNVTSGFSLHTNITDHFYYYQVSENEVPTAESRDVGGSFSEGFECVRKKLT